jgi:hypothetical protein
MKVTSRIFFTAILLGAFAILPLPAQTNPPVGSEITNAAVTNIPAQVVNNSQDVQPSPTHDSGPSSDNGENFTRALALMIPIVAIVMGCSIPIVIVGFQLYFRHRKNQMLHETVRAMVDKGVAIPPEMFQKTEPENSGVIFMGSEKPRRPRNDLRNGLLLIGIGLGAIIVAGKSGWIVFFIGVAFLVVSFFEKKDNNDVQPPKP